MNYEKDIQIDNQALDVEWLNQASLTFSYTKHAAEMRKALDLQREKLNVVKAELDSDIRSSPEVYDIVKITENAVQAAITQTSKYQEAYNIFLEHKYDLDIADGAVRALQDKKAALENLVRLHGASYFAGPSIPRDLSKEWEQKEEQKEVNRNIGKGMRRTRGTQ